MARPDDRFRDPLGHLKKPEDLIPKERMSWYVRGASAGENVRDLGRENELLLAPRQAARRTA